MKPLAFILSLAIFQFAGLRGAEAHDVHKHHLQNEEMGSDTSVKGGSIFHLGSVWKNQKGESLSLSSLSGRPRLLVILYTKCETACPLIVEDLKNVATDLNSKISTKIDVSIFSLDAIRETPQSLQAFAEKRKLPPHWSLFTSEASAVAELTAALGFRYKRLANGEYIHSNVIYFLNAGGEVIAQKEGLKSPRKDFLDQIVKVLKTKGSP